MSRYKKREIYSPVLEELENARFCIKKGIAYVPEAFAWREFYIKRLYLDKDLTSSGNKKDTYLRIDKSKSDRKYNRQKFNEFNVWKEVFRLYKLTRESLEK